MDSIQDLYVGDPACPIIESDHVSLVQIEKLYQLQHDILESIALENDAQKILEKLCIMAESLVPNAISSIMLLNKQGVLNVRAAPSIPPEGILALNGLVPGAGSGSCGNVAYKKMPTFVTNISQDARWSDLKDFAKTFGLGACWSMPVFTDKATIIGTFALSSFEPRVPTLFQRRVLDVCAFIVGIVLKREKQEADLEYLAYYDVLTNIKNRASLILEIEHRSHVEDSFYLLQFGLDRFKIINDSYGHLIGDQLLTRLTHRIKQSFPKENDFFRISGDEFVLLLEGNIDKQSLKEITKGVYDLIASPEIIGDIEFILNGSIGVTRYETDLNNASELLKEVDMAMTLSKAEKNNTDRACFLFDSAVRESIEKGIWLEDELKKAIKQERFELYYQPVMSSGSQKIVAMEALIRWQHSEKGFIPPDIFIPLAEELGIIAKITDWVITQTIEDLTQWHQLGLKHFRVAVNLSGLEFTTRHIMNLIEKIESAGLCDYIDFEITERYLMDKGTAVIELLQAVRDSGIGLSLDDFGTGFSSLSYLKSYPINKLKIDQSLIRDITDDKNDLAITTAIIALASCLDLSIVAEGIETQAHSDILAELGVEYLQGYLFSRPIPKTEMTQLLLETFARVG